MTAALFTPLTLRGVTFPNRAWVSPMCQYSATDGFVGEWHHAHLNAFATGGPGLILTEATAVRPDGRISVACPGIWSDAQAEAWRPIIDFARKQGVPIGVQLAHAGRKGSTMEPWADHVQAGDADGGWTTVAPSAIAFGSFPIPRALTIEEIAELREQFVAAALRAVHVGFDVVELHAAHGYLFHQFLSPLSNLRTDGYGGDFEGRTRLLRETVRDVRAAIPDSMPLFVRASATDWAPGGWTGEETVQLFALLRELGADLADVSTGGLVHDAVIRPEPGYQVPFAAAVRRETGMAVSAVGLITEAEAANTIIASGQADAVMLARAMLRNPRWAINAAEALGEYVTWPKQLERARLISPRKSPQ